MHKGLMCDIVAQVRATFYDEKLGQSQHFLYEMEAIEAAEPGLYLSIFTVEGRDFYVPPSTISMNQTEWIQGVRNGKIR